MGFDKTAIIEFDEKDNKKDREELEKLRKQFEDKFSIDKIAQLKIDDYIVGKQNKESFCYWLETRLEELGNIHGSNASKFGVYYGKKGDDKELKYHFVKKYGKDSDDRFSNIKNEIIELIKNGKENQIKKIRLSKIPPTFRGKILSTYFPDKYLNIFSEEHLDYFLTQLKINYTNKMDIIDKQELLLNAKLADDILSKWSISKYSCFLYNNFGYPNNSALMDSFEDLYLINKVNEKLSENNDDTEEVSYKGRKRRRKPVIKNGGIVFPRDRKVSRNALKIANFQCEIEITHPSFYRKNKINYTEPHHLIPMKFQYDFDASLDVEENIVSLCSNCHNEIHYGLNAKGLIKQLYEKRKDLLKSAGLDITIDELYKMYN